MASHPSSTSLERSALALGLASSLCLAVAAFAAFGDSRNAGWSHLDDLTTRIRANVREAWAGLTAADLGRTDRGTFLEPASELLRLSPTTEPWADPEPAAIRPGPIPTPTAFEALFAESERAELVLRDLETALSLALEAASKEAPVEHLAQARLRAIQLAARLEDGERVRAHWDSARTIAPEIVTGDTSTLLLCALAALPSIDASERVRELEPIVEAWTHGGLILPRSEQGFALADAVSAASGAWHPDPREVALRARLLGSVTPPAEWSAAFEERDRELRRRDFLAWLGTPLPEPIALGEWNLFPARQGLLAVMGAPQGRVFGHLVDAADVERLLRNELEARRALPDGFVLDLRGEADAAGDQLGPWIELAPAFPRVTLRHADVASILREASARTLWLRAGLLVLAVFVAGAALATAWALRRQRRLAEARTAFVANVSHELRTPLASILLMAENLESGRAGENASRYYASLKREAMRLRRLVEDVLDFSRLERGKRFEARIEEVDVPAWMDAVCADADALGAQAGVSLACSRGDLPARANFDREAVRRAVLNLVDNALRHSGSSEVGLRGAGSEHGGLVLQVTDHGKGIAAAHRKAVFEPFTRLNGSASTPGAGLGLAIVREIAHAHGGRVSLRDREGGPGTVFELDIPSVVESGGAP